MSRPKFAWVASFDRFKSKKKRSSIQTNVVESKFTFQAKCVHSQTKVFQAHWRGGENDVVKVNSKLETFLCGLYKRNETMFWSCPKRGKELSNSPIYVSIGEWTFSSRTTSKILEESESKKFDRKPVIKIGNENATCNQNRKRKRYKNTESKRQKNKLQFWNKILNENVVHKKSSFATFHS